MNNAKSKILTHFLKGKVAFMPLETIMTIPNELEYLKGLVKLAKSHKDEEAQQVTHVAIPILLITKQVCVNKNQRNKTLHLTIDIQNEPMDGLVDTSVSN